MPTRPQHYQQSISKIDTDYEPHVLATKDKSVLETLPIELLDQIFAELELKDLVYASLTSPFFWSVSTKHFQNYFMSRLGSWAGQNIICAGFLDWSGEYPAHLFTEEEAVELSRLTCGHSGKGLYEYIAGGHGYRKAAHFHDNKLPGGAQELYNNWRDRRPFTPCFKWLVNIRKDLNYKMLRPPILDFYSTSDKWILRNLTVKEFVRADAIAIDTSRIYGPYIEGIGFGDIILSRICWGLPERDFISSRGIWAGHSFDIITENRYLEEAKLEDEWEDISDQVAREITGICERWIGDNWRDQVMRNSLGPLA